MVAAKGRGWIGLDKIVFGCEAETRGVCCGGTEGGECGCVSAAMESSLSSCVSKRIGCNGASILENETLGVLNLEVYRSGSWDGLLTGSGGGTGGAAIPPLTNFLVGGGVRTRVEGLLALLSTLPLRIGVPLTCR